MDTEGFVRQLNILTGAGVGVILVHTREPHRTEEVLREVAFSKARPFKVWDIVYGWKHYPDNPTDKVTYEKMPDAFGALARINDVTGNGSNAWGEGYFAMHYPHWVLPKHPAFIQCLKHYVRQFAESKQRLILLVPEGFSPPQELQNDLQILDFPLPSEGELAESLEEVIQSGLPEGVTAEVFSDEERQTLVRNATGMTKLEAEAAYAQAIITNNDSWPETEIADFNAVLLKSKTDVVKRSEVLELMEAETFDDVGGLELFKEYVHQRRRAFSEEAREFGVDVPKGIMLVGPPGTGKSLCAKASAASLGLPLIKFDVSRVFGSLVGQSEGRVRSALSQLEAMAPCVALIDEVDKGLGGAHTSGGDSGVSRRVLGAILTHMQESKAPVYWVFTANRVNVLPPELIRKGRLDEVFCVTMPNVTERREILAIHLRKRKQNPKKVTGLKKAVQGSRGFVASELESAVAEAVNQAFHRGCKVTGVLILEQLADMKPISVAFKEDFEYMMQWAQSNARLTSVPEDEPVTVSVATTNECPPRRRRLDT